MFDVTLIDNFQFHGQFFDDDNITCQDQMKKMSKLQIISNIIYSYKYLESDLIKHCHVIFIHSLGQLLMVRSHSKVHRSRRIPKEIPTWASRVSNYSYFPWFNRLQVCRCRRRRNFIYYIEYFRKAAGILLLGVWCNNIRYNIPIITLVGVWPDGLSPLEKLGGWPYFSLEYKPSGYTPTRVIIVYYQVISLI